MKRNRKLVSFLAAGKTALQRKIQSLRHLRRTRWRTRRIPSLITRKALTKGKKSFYVHYFKFKKRICS